MANFDYICACGCRIKREDIKILHWREQGKFKTVKACPVHKHDGYVLNRISVCQKEGCNKEIITNAKGGTVIQFCPKHLKEHLLNKKKRYAKKYRQKEHIKTKDIKKQKIINNIGKRDVKRIDCLHRSDCLDKWVGYRTIPCKNCERYKPGGIEKDIEKQGEYGLYDINNVEFLENVY